MFTFGTQPAKNMEGDIRDPAVSRRKTVKTVGALCSAGAVTPFAGCLGDDGGSRFTTDATVTNWPLLMYSPPYQVAVENGYFEEEGVEIEDVRTSKGGKTTVENVVEDGVAFGEAATPAVVNAHYSDEPVTVVASATNTPGTLKWVSSPDSGVEDVEDLRDENVGFTTQGSVTQSTLSLAFDEIDAVGKEEVEFRATGGLSEGLEAVSQGEVSAAANIEPVFSNQGGEDEWNVVFEATDYVDAFQQTVVVARDDVIENNPEEVEGFVEARNRGVDFVRSNPYETAGIFASHNEGYDAEVMRDAIESLDTDTYYTTGEFDLAGLATVERGMRNVGLIDREVEWSEVIDQSFLDEGKRVDIS